MGNSNLLPKPDSILAEILHGIFFINNIYKILVEESLK